MTPNKNLTSPLALMNLSVDVFRDPENPASLQYPDNWQRVIDL